MDAINTETIEQYYFSTPKRHFRVEYFNECSTTTLCNVDESRVPLSLDPKGLNIVTETGSEKIPVRSTGNKG